MPIIVRISDSDLQELILQGKNSGKYKKISRDKKFVKKLIDIYNLMCSIEHFRILNNSVFYITSS